MNSQFQDLKIFQIPKTQNNFTQKPTVKTIDTIELIKSEAVKNTYPKIFQYGSIISNADDLVQTSEDYTFCVYSVAIGNSFCLKIDNRGVEGVEKKDGYDSIYLENYGGS